MNASIRIGGMIAGCALVACRSILGIEDGQLLPDAEAPVDGAIPTDAATESAPLEAGPDVDGNACGADLSTDPLNCGTCGHDCLGGTCSLGVCQPVTIQAGIEGTETVTDFAIDSTWIYYLFVANTGDHSLQKVPLAGGTPQTLVDLGTEAGTDLFVDATFAYWISADASGQPQLRKAPLASGAASTVADPLGSSSADVPAVATDGVSMYWADPSGTISKVSLGGGTPAALATTQSVASTPVVAVDTTSFYWTTTTYDLKKVGLNGGTPILVVSASSGLGFAGGMAVNTSFAYWNGSGIWEAPVVGGVPTQLVGSGSTGHIVIDSASIYWNDSATVYQVPLGGGNPVTLATTSPISTPRGLAVDATALYWAPGDARIYRLAK
jgi:hypothetical protein